MAAATVSASENNLDLQRLADYVGSLRSVADAGLDGLVLPFKFKVAVATTNIDDSGDLLRICTFPAGFFLSDLAATLTDMDTHATPALVGRLVLLDSADSEDSDVTASTTVGQGGGTVDIAPAAKGKYVGGLTLAWKTNTAAATAAAGTLTVYWTMHWGIIAEDKDVLYLQDY